MEYKIKIIELTDTKISFEIDDVYYESEYRDTPIKSADLKHLLFHSVVSELEERFKKDYDVNI